MRVGKEKIECVPVDRKVLARLSTEWPITVLAPAIIAQSTLATRRKPRVE